MLPCGIACAGEYSVLLFLHRFTGALTLDPDAFEEIEAHGSSAMQSVAVVMLVCLSAGVGAVGLGLTGTVGFISGAILALSGWLVWVAVIKAVGTMTFPEEQTHSSMPELLRTLGFAAAPGVFFGFAAMRAVAPFIVSLVVLWMLASAVVGMRQALDYRSTGRAVAVCACSMAVSLAALFAVAWLFSTRVS